MMGNLKVIGLGNPFRGDDAVGNLVSRKLHPHETYAISVVECGLAGLNLLHEIEGVETAIIIDAVSSQSEEGTIHRFTIPQDLKQIHTLTWSTSTASTHAFGLGEALALAETLGVFPPHLVIYGIEIGNVEPGAPISPSVIKGIHTVVNRITTEEFPLAHA